MDSSQTFDPSFFTRLKEAESSHFWFRVRRDWIVDLLRHHLAPGANILEIGCGTGNISSHLASIGYSVTGCDFYYQALAIAWPGFITVQGDAVILPFKHDIFDAVCLCDVMEHFSDDRTLLVEALRVLKPGGVLLLTVPARNELWSAWDDIAFHKRRYSRGNITTILSGLPLSAFSVRYFFMSLYIPMVLFRKAIKADADLSVSRAANALGHFILTIERYVSRTIPLPIGTSISAVGIKKV